MKSLRMPKRPSLSGFGQRILGGAQANAAHPVDRFMRDEDAGNILKVPVELIVPNPDQPRKHFDQQGMEDLTESIRTRGVLQPIIVQRKAGEDIFTLIAGERRWRASKRAGLAKIPALVRDGSDSAEIALIENLQRENLNPMEEAESLLRLKERRELTDQQLAKIVGKSRVAITESLSLTRLPTVVKDECLRADIYSKRQLLQVLREPNEEAQLDLWRRVKEGRFSGDEARAARKQAKVSRPGPRPYEHKFQSLDRGFTVRVTFRKSRATGDEIRQALRDALRDIK